MRIDDNRDALFKRKKLLEKIKEVCKISPTQNNLRNSEEYEKSTDNQTKSFQEIFEEELKRQK